MNLSRKDLWRTLLSDGMNPHRFHRRPTKFLRMLLKQKYFHPGLKERERETEWKEGCQTSKILHGYKQVLSLKEKEKGLPL